jgi:hypothetical protein
MHPHFPVIDDAALALMDELDGVFDGDDVVLAGSVRLVDDGGQGSRFTAPRRARYEDEPPGKGGQLGDHGRQTELLGGEDRAGNFTENGGATPLLHEKIGPVASQVGDLVGKIHVSRLFELLDLVLRGDLVEHGLEAVVVEEIIFDPLDFAANTDGGLLSGDQVQIGCALVVHQLEKSIDFGHRNPPNGP